MTTDVTGTNRPTWQAETDQPGLAEALKTGLSEIMDPEIGLNIIQLGLVRNVEIAPDNAHITIILTTPFCPYGPALLETTKQKAEEVLGRPVELELGMEMWDFSMMEEGLGGDWGLY
jgi:metal-sulfur cluster biosynthetic enzyme